MLECFWLDYVYVLFFFIGEVTEDRYMKEAWKEKEM